MHSPIFILLNSIIKMTSIKQKEKETISLSNHKGKKLRQWDPKNMAKAIAAVRNKEMGWTKAAKQMGVPRRTLQRLADEKYGSPEEAASCKHGKSFVFTAKLEKELVEYCLMMRLHFHGLTTEDLRRMALQLAVRNNIRHPFSNIMAGKGWLAYFLKRHPNLSIDKPAEISFAKKEEYETSVNKFFDALDAAFDEHSYPSDRIFNVDATGLTIVPSKIPRIIERKDKQIDMMSSAERKCLVTVICAMNAAGTFVPPMIIFPRKDVTNLLMRGAPPCSVGVAHPSGWVQSNLFTQWFKHFIDKTKPNKNDPVLLLLDGHYSHVKNIELIDLSKEHFIKIISFPQHTTFEFQPLYKSFMNPLITSYAEEVKTWMSTTGKSVTQHDIMNLFGRAYIKCQTAEIAINGFKSMGIYPPNRNIFFNANYLTSQEENQEAKREAYSKNSSDMPQIPMSETLSVDSDILDKASCSTKPFESQASTSSDVSLFDISPVPAKRRKVSTRGRGKPSKVQTIISCTYNKGLIQTTEEKKEQGSENKRGRSRGEGRGRSHNQIKFVDQNINNNIPQIEATKKLTFAKNIDTANNTTKEQTLSNDDLTFCERASPCGNTLFYFVDCSLNFHDNETLSME